MSNLATIVNNILADSGIDDINVVVTTGSYNNPAWITALDWSKITNSPLGNYLPLVGGTMTGNINWAQTDRGITWAFNTDGAYIKFFNTGDGDTDSRLEFATLDNNDEYFRWVHLPSGGSTYELMRLRPISDNNSELIVRGKIIKSGGTSSQFLKANGDVDSNTYALTNQTMHIGTTAVAINRASGALSLSGVSIDGSSGSSTLLNASGALTTQYGNGKIGYSYNLTEPQTGLFPAIDNSNAIITINRHPDNYYSQLGFSSNGSMYYRSFSAAAINTIQSWRIVWDSGNLTPQTQLNGTGFVKASGTTITYDNTSYLPLGGGVLTGVLSIQTLSDPKLRLIVPSGDTSEWNYIDFVGSDGVRDAYFGTDGGGNPTWYRDDNGLNIGLGSVATVNGVQIVTNSGTWAINVTGTAGSTNTLMAYGGSIITQAGSGTVIYNYALSSSTAGLFPTSDNSNSIITLNRHPDNYYSQLGFNSTGGIYYRSFNATAINTTQPWQNLLTSNNYNSYAPTLTGGGASGTWGINVTGSSNSALQANVAYNLQAADSTLVRFNTVHNTDFSTMTFFSRAWQTVQGANGLAYNFTTHTNGGSAGYGALQIYYGEGGHVFAPTSFRAPLFVSSNNTGYYLNPSGFSNLRTVHIDGYTQFALTTPGMPENFGNGRIYLRIHPVSSGARIISFRMMISATWNWAPAFGYICADVSFYFDGSGFYNNSTTITSATGSARVNLNIGQPVIENGFVSVPIFSVNTNSIFVKMEGTPSFDFNAVSYSSWESVSFPGSAIVRVPGPISVGGSSSFDAPMTISASSDGMLTLRTPSGDSNEWNYIQFVLRSGTRRAYFGLDGGGAPQWYRDDNGLTVTLGSTLTVNGAVTATAFFESSDARLKSNIINLDVDASSITAKHYIKNGVEEIGYLAQDVEAILPSAISKRDDGYLDLSYRQVHTAKIAALEKEVKELKEQLKNK